jgi:hypothetical protein
LEIKLAAEELLAIAQRAEKFSGCKIDIFGIAGVEDNLLGVAFAVADTKVVAEMR